MRIAVASADGGSISHHFGRSQCFIVYEVEGKEIVDCTVRPNRFTAHAKGECNSEHEHHGSRHSHSSIVAALRDCDTVLCYGMGWRAAEDLKNNGITPVVIGQEATPREAVEQYLAGHLKPAGQRCQGIEDA